MSGLDKILEHISSEAADNASKIIANAKAEAERILSSEKADPRREPSASGTRRTGENEGSPPPFRWEKVPQSPAGLPHTLMHLLF